MELTPAHLRYLLAIYEVSQTHLDISSRSIAEKLGVTKPSVVRVLNLLMERGMPPRRRRTTPVVCINGEPAAVYGVGTDQRFLPGKDGSNINILMIEKNQEEESNG